MNFAVAHDMMSNGASLSTVLAVAAMEQGWKPCFDYYDDDMEPVTERRYASTIPARRSADETLRSAGCQ